MTRYAVSGAELRALARRGEISRVSLVRPLSPLHAYRGAIDVPEPTGVRVLDQPLKHGGFPNLHHAAYVEISRRYLRDDLRLIRTRPREYLTGVGRGLVLFFWPATNTGKLERNRERIAAWDRLWNTVVYGTTGYARGAGLLLALAYAGAVVAGTRVAVRAAAGVRHPGTETLLFIWLTTLYVAIGSSLTEVGENYHFRYVLDPVVAALVAVGVAELVRRRRSRAATA